MTPGTEAPTTEPATPGPPQGSVVLEATLPLRDDTQTGGTVRAVVHPLQSSASEGLSVLTVEFAGPADLAQNTRAFMSVFMGPEGGSLPTGFAVFDPSTGTAARPLGIGGSWAAESDKFELFPGQTTTLTLGFPPVGGASIFVMVPGFDVVEVPVVQAAAAQMPGSAATWAASSEKTGSFVPIESWAMSLVTRSTVEAAGDQVLVELPADVLFAFNKSELSKKAQKVVEKAGRKIAEAAAAEGEITVVGHTDDQGDDASNDRLAKARAESVAARLRPILGSSFTVKTVGKGSREPKVKGTSDEARAANRRVEITFTGRSANKLVVVEDVPTELPRTAGVVVPGTETAQLPADGTNPQLEARMLSLRRVGGQLVGVLEIAAPTEKARSTMLFGNSEETTGVHSERGFSFLSIANVSLLTPTTRVFPADFKVDIQGKSVHRILGSSGDHVLPHVNGPFRYVLVWPDVDPSATTVTVDAPDGYRFLDVPIR